MITASRRPAQQGTTLLACQRFHMDRAEDIDAHHLRNAARVISVGLVDLRL
jgi:hypothetical protein